MRGRAEIIVTFPLLEGIDGVRKMSKSVGNYIALNDTSTDMYGKLISIPDRILSRYYDLLTDIASHDRTPDPYAAKKHLAHLLTAQFHDVAAADAAEDDFATRFSARQIPADVPEATVNLLPDGFGLLDLMCRLEFASSNSETRRLVQQRAVKVDGHVIVDPRHHFHASATLVLAVGKRRITRVRLQ